MRSKYTPDVLLLATAKKKPRLQELIDKLPEMSDEDINSLSVQPWIKQALGILKIRGGKDQKEYLNDLIVQANEQVAAEDRIRSDRFTVRTWNNQNDQIFAQYPGTTIKSYIEIKHGEPFLIQDSQTIVLSGDFLNLTISEMTRVLNNSNVFKEMTKQEYFNYYNIDYLSSRY
ncbi:MAG: hypothetical protein M0R77_02555 [Gammaproteobacteria bacterium]|nr:hypothetical protein [Gammaproteobacteria bacterium]